MGQGEQPGVADRAEELAQAEHRKCPCGRTLGQSHEPRRRRLVRRPRAGAGGTPHASNRDRDLAGAGYFIITIFFIIERSPAVNRRK
jgi:hypothetical protein